MEFPVGPGQSLRWEYSKDGSVSSGADAVWVRNIELPLAGAGGGGGDSQPPQTTASPPGGNFGAAQQVALSCTDAGGSGCAAIHFTIDGSTPTTASTVYGAPLTISATTTLKFFAVDFDSNQEAVRTAQYVIDNVPPSIAITTPTDGANVTQPLSEISGTVADASAISAVDLQVTKPGPGGTLYLNNLNAFTSTPASVRAIVTGGNWSYSTAGVQNWEQGTVYSVTATATDTFGNASSRSITFSTGIAGLIFDTQFKTAVGGAIGVALSSDSVTPNGTLDVTGILHIGGSLAGLSRAGKPVTLTITKPDQTVLPAIEVLTSNADGAFAFRNVGGFDLPGLYNLRVAFAGNAMLRPTQFDASVVVGQAGYAVIVQGKITSGSGLDAHNKTTDRIYQTLLERGFLKENIRYFAFQDPNRPEVFGEPSVAAVGNAITTWAHDRINAGGAGPLYVILVNHGNDEVFHLDEETITPVMLDGWLDTLEAGLSPAQLAEKRVVMLGSCFSGSFIPALSDPDRIVITSAAANEQAYKGVAETDGIPVGSYFMEELFRELGAGNNLRDAFRIATDLTELFTAQGPGSANSDNPYQDGAVQHPQPERQR